MKSKIERFILFFFVVLGTDSSVQAQETNRVLSFFPAGTVLRGNISYAGDTLRKHLLDVYIPAQPKPKSPLVVWIHGGGWMVNDKYADMSYMKKTVGEISEGGYVVASIDYRFSTQAIFPAQVQDCNQAIEFLYQHAAEFGIDREKIAVIGFSAGGHLASLLTLSNNAAPVDFQCDGKPVSFKVSGAVDFYGPADLATMPVKTDDTKSSLALLLGGPPGKKADLARKASPVHYIDKNDPPFLIIQGEKDQSVPRAQSEGLSSQLNSYHVRNKLIVVPGAPHFGEMFDDDYLREEVMVFLDDCLLGIGEARH